MSFGLLPCFIPFKSWEDTYDRAAFIPETDYIGDDKFIYCKTCHKRKLWLSPTGTHWALTRCECSGDESPRG